MSAKDRPVLILGGGINGAAIARELALNGVSVELVERRDLSYGATAYSSRLIHGGLRYLEYGEFGLVRESLEERNRLLALAPSMVRPLKLYIPVARRLGGLRTTVARFLHLPRWLSPPAKSRGLWLVRAGLRFYDRFAQFSGAAGQGSDHKSIRGALVGGVPPHDVHRPGDAGAPGVDGARFRWLCSYYDGQLTWPERFVIALLSDARRAAEEQGSALRVRTYTTARLIGDTAELLSESGEVVAKLRPAAVVNATGAWVDETLQRLPIDSRRLMGGTKGTHLLTYHNGLRAALGDGGVYAEAADGRPVFVLPLGDATLIGTTDLPYSGDPGDAVATEDEIHYLLDAVRGLFPRIVLSREDVTLHCCGVRPLPHVDANSAAAITRRHWLEAHALKSAQAAPVFSVIGGKLTTCRSLAEQTAATVLQRIGRRPTRDSRDRPLVDPLSSGSSRSNAAPLGVNASGADFLGSIAPEQLDRVVRNEWVERLEDLAERRLLVHYRERLDRDDLVPLADALVRAGKLARNEAAAEIARCLDRFARHYGRRVTQSGPPVK